MDPLTTEPLGDSEEEHIEEFDCSADVAGGTSSEHNSPKSSTHECSPYASAVEIGDNVYRREERYLGDNGDMSVHSNTKPIRFSGRVAGFRLSDGHKKSVQMQFEGRKFKSATKSYLKKEKQPVCQFCALFVAYRLPICILLKAGLLSDDFVPENAEFCYDSQCRAIDLPSCSIIIKSVSHFKICKLVALSFLWGKLANEEPPSFF